MRFVPASGGRVLAVLTAALLLVLTAPATAPSAAAAANGGVTSSVIYRADVRERVIDVAETFTIEPGTASFEAVIPAAAESVSSTMTTLRRESRDPFWDVLTLSPSGAASGELSYRFASVPIRSEGGVSISGSYIGFALWPTNATAVKIILPTGFVIAENRGLFDAMRTRESTEIVYSANFPGDLQDFWFVALAGEAFQSRWVEAEGDTIQIAAWVGDDVWLDHTEQFVAKGVPELRRLTGIPWPEHGLQVQSARPTEQGYGGWYVRSRSLIEINSSMDTETLLHELSHAWFNSGNLNNRWLVEGLAEEFASRSYLGIEGIRTEPQHPGPPPAGWAGLLEWEHRSISHHSWDVELYGYATSWYTVDALTDDLDPDAVRRVMVGMLSNRLAYGIESDPRSIPVNDWRRFLDMLEIEGGSTTAAAMYREWVLPGELGFILDARLAAQEELNDLSRGDLATVPIGIRTAMNDWEFDSAESQIVEARLVRARLHDVEETAGHLGLEMPPELRRAYLTNTGDYGALNSEIEQATAVLDRFDREGFDANEGLLFEMGRSDLVAVAPDSDPPGFGRQLNPNRPSSVASLLQLAASLLVLTFVAAVGVAMLRRVRMVQVQPQPDRTPPPPTTGLPAPPPSPNSRVLSHPPAPTNRV